MVFDREGSPIKSSKNIFLIRTGNEWREHKIKKEPVSTRDAGSFLIWQDELCYFFNLFLKPKVIRPNSPDPNKSMVAGSGAGRL